MFCFVIFLVFVLVFLSIFLCLVFSPPADGVGAECTGFWGIGLVE